MRGLRIVVAALMASGLPGAVRGQAVLIAPHAVVVEDGARAGAFTVVNVGPDRVEVTLSTAYGYPVTDSAGWMVLQTVDVVDDTMPSAAGWIEMFPRRFSLESGARRTVRLRVSPPAGTADREYWARLVVASRSAAVPFAASVEAVSVAIALEVRSVFPLLFRKGALRTAVDMGPVTATRRGDSLDVRVPLERRGNAAWIGTVFVSLVDVAGRTASRAELPLGVYYGLHPRLALPMEGVDPGRYTLRVEAVGRRADLPAAFVLPTIPVSRTVEIVWP